ncbi:MAG: sigma-70 family RNA polymerase sigma factor [Myxococcota bacterium]
MAQNLVDQQPIGRAAASGRTARFDETVDPDRDLVERWQAGDAGSFETLVKRHQGRVYRLLYRMLGNHEEAQDVSQETFLNLHRHGRRFRRQSRFSTFVYRVAANAALNRRRSLGRDRNRVGQLAVCQLAGEHLPELPRSPEESLSRAQLSRRVHAALLTLPERLRLPLVLFDLEGLPYAEISRVMAVPEGTVKSRIHRARHALRAELGDIVGAQGPAR